MKSHPPMRRAGLLVALAYAAITLAACGPTPDPTTPRSPAETTVNEERAYTIRGSLEGLADGTGIQLIVPSMVSDPLNVEPIASATVRNGSFVLNGNVDVPVPAVLSLGGRSVKLVLEPGELRIEEGALGPVAAGGTLTSRVYGYLEQPDYVAAYKANQEAGRKAFAGVDENDEAAMKAARALAAKPFQRLMQVKNEYDHAILESDAPALLKLLVLSENYDWKRYDQDTRARMLASFRQTLGDHPVIVAMERAAAEQKRTEQLADKFGPGKPYADIDAVDLEGRAVKLSDVLAKNKLVLLDFWASWCGPCRGEFPHLLKVYREFHEHGFEIYAVSLDEDKADWTRAMHEEGGTKDLPWINLQAPGFDAPAARTYGVLQLPQNYLIASDGTIVGVGMREWDVERAVRKQLEKTGNVPSR